MAVNQLEFVHIVVKKSHLVNSDIEIWVQGRLEINHGARNVEAGNKEKVNLLLYRGVN
jgi:hypothetical protein